MTVVNLYTLVVVGGGHHPVFFCSGGWCVCLFFFSRSAGCYVQAMSNGPFFFGAVKVINSHHHHHHHHHHQTWQGRDTTRAWSSKNRIGVAFAGKNWCRPCVSLHQLKILLQVQSYSSVEQITLQIIYNAVQDLSQCRSNRGHSCCSRSCRLYGSHPTARPNVGQTDQESYPV